MSLFDWLLGRKHNETSQWPEEPDKRTSHFDHDTRNRNTAIVAAETEPSAPRPTTTPKEPTAGDIFDLDYSAGGGQEELRRVTFLFSTPGPMVTAIDLRKRRVRTYRIDRMKHIIRPSDQKVYEPGEFFRTYPIIDTVGWRPEHEDLRVAAQMRSQMFCQLSLLVLMGTADGPITSDRLDTIMAYARRENRFATREGWVPTGDKRGVWPILRDMVHQLRPSRDQIDIFVGTIRENWESPRRFDALSEALTVIGNFGGEATDATRAIAAEINRLAS